MQRQKETKCMTTRAPPCAHETLISFALSLRGAGTAYPSGVLKFTFGH